MVKSTTKLLLTDMVPCLDNVPSNYIRPPSERPNLKDVQAISDVTIPLIDLQDLQIGPGRSEVVEKIGRACQNYGFFQIKNHGVTETMVNNMLRLARDFFQLPESERLKLYSDNPSKTVRVSTSFNVKTEKVANWRDFLRLHCYPLEDFVHEWPSNPPSFREEVAEYCTSVRVLILKLVEAICESLGLEKNYINGVVDKQGQQHMSMNYYPPCPQPELTCGLPIHSDCSLITILLQDDVPGLQFLKNGKWVAVNPIPNTFIVNIGDQMQVISNDRYKSVLHRAVVNRNKGRFSIPTFYCPSPHAVIGPAPELVREDQAGAVYRNFTYQEYYTQFWNRGLAGCSLDPFKASPKP